MGWAALLAGLLLKSKAAADYADDMRNANIVRAKRRDAINERNRAKVMEETQEFKPENRQEIQDVAEQDILSRVNTDLARTLKQAESAQTTTGLTGAALKDKAMRTRASADKASTLASLLSRYRAPGQARQEEGRRGVNFGLDRRGIASEGRQQDRVDVNWLNSIRPDATKEMLGSLLMAYGGGAVGGEAGAVAASAASGYGARGSTVPGDAYQPARDIFTYGGQ